MNLYKYQDHGQSLCDTYTLIHLLSYIVIRILYIYITYCLYIQYTLM